MKLLTEYTHIEDLELVKEEFEGIKKPVYRIKGPFLQAEQKNRNGRVYSKQLLEREVNNFQDKILKKRAVGALDHPSCFLSNDFDVLTEFGWKTFNDLTIGENIFTLNDKDEMELHPIENKINQFYEGHAYHIKSRNIDSKFTPTHRFLLEDRYGKKEYVTIEEIYNNRTKYCNHRILKLGKWYGEDKEFIIIPKIENTNYNWYDNDISQDLIINSHLFCQFLGIYLAEGWIKNNGYSIYISQNKGEKADQIEEMLLNLPFKINKEIKGKNIRFNFSDRRLWEYLKLLGNKYTKYIPYEIKQLPPYCLEELIDWFILGDGCRNIVKGVVRRQLFSVSKRLVEDFHECVVKSGHAGNWEVIIPKRDYFFGERLIKKENKKPLYILNILTTKTIRLLKHNLKIEKINHSGDVFCLTVKNSNFYIKQNNKAYWTGNSPTVCYKDASHLIESLQMVGNDGIGIAKILNTPDGLIVQNLIDEGILLGVSTRGVGTLTGEKVNEDYKLITVDIVSEPSALGAFVDGILENKDYFINESGQIVEKAIENLQNKVDKKADSQMFAKYLREFFKEIRKTI